MDLTTVVNELLAALVTILVPLIVAYVGYWCRRALKAIETNRYADALQEYDAALYSTLADAGRVAVSRARDSADTFTEDRIVPYLYRAATEVEEAFEKKAGVRVDLSEARVEALVDLAISEAWKAAKKEARGPL